MSDRELEELYRRAGTADRARPNARVRQRILAHAAQVAASSSRRISLRSTGWLAVPAAAAVIAAMILVPRHTVTISPPSHPIQSAAKPSSGQRGEAEQQAPAPAPAPAPATTPSLAPPIPTSSGAPDAGIIGGIRAQSPSADLSESYTSRRSASAERRLAQDLEPPTARMQRAAIDGNAALLRSLTRQYPALVDQRDAQGRTLLMLATLHHHREVVEELLANGADPNAADRGGRTPLDVANSQGDDQISAALKLAGARAVP
jgi:Ankyrin repeats (many copies)